MVNGGEGAVCSPDFSSGISQALEGLRGGHLVHEMSVDVEEGVAVAGRHDVVVKDLVVEGSGSGSGGGHDAARKLWVPGRQISCVTH